jgi:hypothetical protein
VALAYAVLSTAGQRNWTDLPWKGLPASVYFAMTTGVPTSVYLAMKKGLPASVYFAMKTAVP